MSSSLTVEESPLEQLLHNVEDALFGTVFELQKTRKEDYVRINYLTGLSSIILDLFQLLPFFVHGKKLISIALSVNSQCNRWYGTYNYSITSRRVNILKTNYENTGYGFGTITLTWGRFLRYIQLQLQLSTWDAFAVGFFHTYRQVDAHL